MKLLITGALSGLVLGPILMMIVVYRLTPLLQSRRQRSLRDQHQMPIPRFGGVGMAGLNDFWGGRSLGLASV